MNKLAKKLLAAVTCAALLAQTAAVTVSAFTTGEQRGNTETETPYVLWYDEPAVNSADGWKKQALPVGNGHMGAMMFGMTDTERIQMNEETLWTGGPGGDYSATNADAYGNVNVEDPAGTMENLLDEVFDRFYSGNNSTRLPSEYLPNKRYAIGCYQNFAEMYVDFGHKDVANYKRQLDLNKAMTSVSYDSGDVTYTREMFASYPDNVMVYKVSASKAGALSFTLRPQIPDMTATNTRYNYTGKTGTVNAEGDTITLRGTLKQNGLNFEGQYKVIPTGGELTAQNDENGDHGKITVTGADSAYVIIALGTDYANSYPDYRGEDPHDGVSQRIADAAGLGYDKLLESHQADYRNLFDRVSIDLGGEFPADKTTDVLLADYQKGSHSQYLEQLYYQFGRYMLISSSREDSLPANLQGVWNDTYAPMWQSDYHNNINIQMNYWPAMETNLAETAESLVEYVDSLREPGRVTLEKVWGIKSEPGEENGWMLNVSNNPFGFTGNVDNEASFTPGAIAFICQNLWDYYAFTQDKDYLKSTIYPIMKESCKTYIQTLQPGRTEADKDKLYSAPSYSSEQGPWTVGVTFDQQLIYQLFKDTAAAAGELGVDADLVAQLTEMMPKLDPIRIGDSGQIKEWQQETSYNTDQNGKKLGDPAHRHNSQLVALYPGNVITSETEEWMDAAKTTLTLRGDEATGWSMGHKLNLWARTGDGNHAYKLLNNLLSKGTFSNLFDYHIPSYYQIDGNFGGTAGITEMLLQSYAGYVELLPALPETWKQGSYSGLVARGNFEMSVGWNNQIANAATVTSKSGNPLQLKYHKLSEATVTRASDGQKVEFEVLDRDMIKFDTIAGETYVISNIPQDKKVSNAKTFLRSSVNNLYNKDILNQTGMTDENGVFFETVTGASAAEQAGFQVNDVICALNGTEVTDTEQMLSVYAAMQEGTEITAKVWRQSGFLDITFTKSATDEFVLLPGKIQAENFNEIHGSCFTEACADDGSLNIGGIANGDYLVYKDVSFEQVPTNFSVRTAGKTGSSTIVARLDSLDGPIVATATTGKTGAWATYQTFTAKTENRDLLTGTHDLYICLKSGLNLNWFSFEIDPREELSNLNEQAKAVDPLAYTGESTAKLAAAVAEAERILAASEYTQQEIEAAIQGLKDAMALVPRPESFRYILTAVRYADAIAQTDYVNDSRWAEIQEKRDALVALIDTDPEDLTQATAAADSLVASAKGLSIAAQSVKIDDKDDSITYGYGKDGPDPNVGNNGTWYNYNGTKYYQGSMTNCKSAWAWAELPFTGNRVTYITEKAQGSSLVNIYIDGNLIDTVDTFDGGSGLPQTAVFDSADYPELALSDGPHTIRVETTDQKNPVSSPIIFRVDAFEVFSGEQVIADKTALFSGLKEALGIAASDLTDASAEALKAAVDTAAAQALDVQLSQQETDTAAAVLADVIDSLEYSQPPEKTDKSILEKVLAKAKELKETQEYSNAILSVRTSFDAALEAADKVCQAASSTQQQIDKAWIALMNEIHKLGFQMGDKDSLQALVDEANTMNGKLGAYVDGSAKERFVAALAAAEEVLADQEAMQDSVSEAETALLDAMLEMRYKADKSVLQSVLAQAEELDLDQYTPETVAAFNSAEEGARQVDQNELATQQQVDAAVENLRQAISALSEKTSVRGNASNASGQSGTPKTGETVPAAAVALLMLTGAVLVGIRKKKCD